MCAQPTIIRRQMFKEENPRSEKFLGNLRPFFREPQCQIIIKETFPFYLTKHVLYEFARVRSVVAAVKNKSSVEGKINENP